MGRRLRSAVALVRRERHRWRKRIGIALRADLRCCVWPGEVFEFCLDLFEIIIALTARLLDAREHPPQSVEKFQQCIGDPGGELNLTASQQLQNTLACVSERAETMKVEKSGVALDRVQRAESAVAAILAARILFKSDQIAVQPIEPLPALNKKLLYKIIRLTHGVSRQEVRGPAHCVRDSRSTEYTGLILEEAISDHGCHTKTASGTKLT